MPKNRNRKEKNMKKYTKYLLFLFSLTIILSVPAFAGMKDIFPVSANYGAGNVMFGTERTIKSASSGLENGDVIKTINVTAIKGLKTTFQIKTKDGNKVAWNKSGTKKSWKNNKNLYSIFSVTPKKDAVYYATILNGKNNVKVKFKITSVVNPTKNHVMPSFVRCFYVHTNEYDYDDIFKYVKSFSNNSLWQYNEKSFLFKPKSSDEIKRCDGSKKETTLKPKAGKMIDLIVRSVDGVKFKWSELAPVTTRNGISILRIKPTKPKTIYCTVSCGSVKIKVPFCIKVRNDFKAVNTNNIKLEKYAQSQNSSYGESVSFMFGIMGNDIENITIKEKRINGKDFKSSLGPVESLKWEETCYRKLFILFTPTSSGKSIFTVSDQYGNSFDIYCKVTLK